MTKRNGDHGDGDDEEEPVDGGFEAQVFFLLYVMYDKRYKYAPEIINKS